MTYAYAEDDSSNAVIVVSERRRIMNWNGGAQTLFGWTAEEAVGRDISMLFPEGLLFEIDQIRACLKKGEAHERLDTLRRRKDGRTIPVTVEVSRATDATGAPIFVATFRPTSTDRVEDLQFRHTIDDAPAALIVVDGDGVIQIANRMAEIVFGYERQALLGMNVDLLAPEASRAAHARERAVFAAKPDSRPMGGLGADRRLLGRRADGSTFPVEIALNPVATPKGIQVAASIVDITARVRSEELLQTEAETLRQSNAELEQFAYIASHDLQEPLRIVANYAQLLAEKYEGRLDERADRYIGHIVAGARRMQGLVRDLLGYSRLSGQNRPRRRLDPNPIVAEALDRLSDEIAAAGASVERDPLPEVESDDTELGQIFQNLLSNAIKFRGEHPPRIRIGARQVGAESAFYVADNGIGIDPRFHSRIFLMFQRLHERGKYEGSGVGLAVVRKVVEKHGGRIWVASEPGRGATFYFTLSAQPKE